MKNSLSSKFIYFILNLKKRQKSPFFLCDAIT